MDLRWEPKANNENKFDIVPGYPLVRFREVVATLLTALLGKGMAQVRIARRLHGPTKYGPGPGQELCGDWPATICKPQLPAIAALSDVAFFILLWPSSAVNDE